MGKSMGTNTRMNLTRELEKLSKEVRSRSTSKNNPGMRMLVWKYTVAISYKLKRFVDFIVALTAIVLLFPLMFVIAVAIKLTSPGPIIFSQVRVGRYGRHFMLYKFRSMYNDAEKRKADLMDQNEAKGGLFKMKKDPRVTPVGRLIRKTSLDELPQLVNVLVGDMSLVGPRPHIPDEVKEYTLEARKLLNVIPGLTGLPQISGRSDIEFQKQISLDKKYIASHSLWSDFCIIMRTIPAIIIGRGAY